MKFKQWKKFESGDWQHEINVRDFIQKNYTPYEGNSDFLKPATEKTKKLWEKRITENTTLSMESVQWMAQRINSLLEYMRYGYALIAYRKQDGSFYMGRGTLVSYESDFKKKHDMTSIKAHVAYWDAEQQGWRTFLIENFMEWRPIVN